MVFHEMPYFLQRFAKNLVKTLKHGSLHKKLLVFRRSTSFDDNIPYRMFLRLDTSQSAATPLVGFS